MAFPTTGVLDNFNRADGPLGANWTTPFWGDAAPVVLSNQLNAPDLSGWNGCRWNFATYGPDCEVYITAADHPEILRGLFLRLGGTDANPDGYEVSFDNTAFCKVYRLDAGVSTKLGADFSISGYAAGSTIGFEAVGSTLTVYHKASGGSWASVTSRTDATYGSAGYLAVECNQNCNSDDFGGGTIGAAGGAAGRMMIMGVG